MSEHQMESKKGDSRMDVAALTDSDSNYYDTQEYVFIRRAQNNDTSPSSQPPTSHPDNHMLPLQTTTTSTHNTEQEPQDQQEQAYDEASTEGPAPTKCTLTYCCICTHGLPPSFQSPPTWSEVCRVAMYALELGYQDRKYFHIRKEICPFIETHYDILVPKSKSISWRQTVNMTLSHPQYSHIFMQESQDHEYGRRKGYYCLRQHVDLYKIPEPEKKTRRKRYLDEANTKKKSKNENEYDSPPGSPSPHNDFPPNTTTTTTTTTTTDSELRSSAEESENDQESSGQNKKGLIKKLETDLFLYFLERKSHPTSEDDNLGDSTLPPLTSLSPNSHATPVPTPLPSIPSLTASAAKPNVDTPVPPALPSLHTLPKFNSPPSRSSTSTTSSTPTPSSHAPKSSVTQLVNDESRTEHSSLFSQWQSKPKVGSSENSSAVNWNIKREPTSHHDSYNSPPGSTSKHTPFSGKLELEIPPHEYSHQYGSSKFPPTSGRPSSPGLNKQSPYGGLSHMLPHHPTLSHPHTPQLKRSGSPVSWQYEQPGSQSPFSPYSSPSPYPPYSSSPYPSHPPYHYNASPFQKGPLPHPHDQPLPFPQSAPQTPQTPIQIHQSPLQQKQQQQQQQHQQQQHKNQISPSASSTTSSPPSPTSSSKSSQPSLAQQPQRRNRLTTRPWERAILEDYYISYFCQSRHSRREKVKVDELVKKLGWEISRIQRWLDNRRTKDRPRFGHPEFGAAKGDESDSEDNTSAKKMRHSDDSPSPSHSPSSTSPPSHSTPPPPPPPTTLPPTSATKAITPINSNNNGSNKNKNIKKLSKRKGSDDEDDSPSPPPSPSSNSSTPLKKKKPSPPSSASSTTPPPPNPNQANTDFWVIKNK